MLIVNTTCAIVFMLALMFLVAAGVQRTWGVQHGFARIVLGALINDIRNAIGSVVFSSWKGVNYIRGKAVTVSNPNSGDQANMRARLAAAAKYWYDTLTAGQRAGWEEFAQQQGSSSDSEQAQEGGTKVVIPDNRGVMSGFNAFCMVQCLGYSAGTHGMGDFLASAPLGIEPPNAPTDLLCVCYGDGIAPANNYFRLDWTAPVPTPNLSSARIRIWGVSLDGGVHRQLIGSVDVSLETFQIDTVKAAQGQTFDIGTLPGHYHLQVDCISGYALKSPPSNVCQPQILTTACEEQVP